MVKKNISFYKKHLKRLIKKYLPQKRKPKFSIVHKLDVIIKVLKNGTSWISLDEKADESSYRKFYNTLVKEQIFQKSYENLANCVFEEKIKNDVSFIDSTTIFNKTCLKDSVSFCSKDRKHKGLKITTIVNENQIPLGISFEKGSVHDVKLVEPTLEKIIKKPENIVGDKGYISSELKKKLGQSNIKLVYPYRNYNKSKTISKNGNKKHSKLSYPKNTPEEKKLLKKRYLVEHFFSYFKKFKRISFIYEKKKENFEGFCYIAFSLILIKKCLEL